MDVSLWWDAWTKSLWSLWKYNVLCLIMELSVVALRCFTRATRQMPWVIIRVYLTGLLKCCLRSKPKNSMVMPSVMCPHCSLKWHFWSHNKSNNSPEAHPHPPGSKDPRVNVLGSRVFTLFLRTRWRDYIYRLAWEKLDVSPDKLEEVARGRSEPPCCCPHDPTSAKQKKMPFICYFRFELLLWFSACIVHNARHNGPHFSVALYPFFSWFVIF